MQSAGLGYVSAAQRGQSDALLTSVAQALLGIKALCGVVQTNTEYDPDRPCHMDLQVLGTSSVIRISQYLGAGSKGCRLDPSGLETAVAQVEQGLTQETDLLIINKFGKQECEGRGFRPLIGQALSMGIPVLTAVSAINLPRFLEFAEGMAVALPGQTDAVLDWVRQAPQWPSP